MSIEWMTILTAMAGLAVCVWLAWSRGVDRLGWVFVGGGAAVVVLILMVAYVR